MKNNDVAGFTLVEVMVVIIVMALVTAIAVPMYVSMTERAKQATTKGYLGTLRAATNIYYGENYYYPYQNTDLSNIDGMGNTYDTIKTAEQKQVNSWVPKNMSEWPQLIRIGRADWASATKIHETGNDMRIYKQPIDPKANNDWDEEIVYIAQTGELYLNCNLTDKEGRFFYEW
jgi:prepilin-type N-terminal cleavage/methylation domain-containing protein